MLLIFEDYATNSYIILLPDSLMLRASLTIDRNKVSSLVDRDKRLNNK